MTIIQLPRLDVPIMHLNVFLRKGLGIKNTNTYYVYLEDIPDNGAG